VAEQGQTIPVPDNFGFEWDTPEEATRFWTVDLMHWPNGISPLAATMDIPAFVRGLNKAATELRMPFTRVKFKPIRGYIYQTFNPYSTDPTEMNQRMVDMLAQMGKHIPGLLDRWRDEYEPEVRSINDETLNGDYSKLGDRDLAELLQLLVEKREREGELHFLAVFPAMGAVAFYEQVYTNLLGEPAAEEHLQLLQGFPNKTVGRGARLRCGQHCRHRGGAQGACRGGRGHQLHDALPGQHHRGGDTGGRAEQRRGRIRRGRTRRGALPSDVCGPGRYGGAGHGGRHLCAPLPAGEPRPGA